MQISSRLLYKTAIIMLGLMLIAGLVVLSSYTKEANALSSGEWESVRGYIASFYANQYTAGSDGEAGFTINRTTLKSRIDSNANWDLTAANAPTQILGEGDDAANAPVLLDNLVSTANVIPGTSVRCNYSGGYGSATAPNCFDTGKVTDIENRVNAHEAAGFSTDIVLYCASGRTESVTAGGIGALAQTGALGGTTTPKVLGFKWGRNGWTATTTTSTSTAGATGTVAAPSTTYANGTNASGICSGAANDEELVRCTAQWAIYSGTATAAPWGTTNGYNHGNGSTLAPTASNVIIDVRSPSTATTMKPAGVTAMQIPVNNMFSVATGLQFISTRTTTTKNLFVGRTMHLPLMVSTNAVMLGYNATGYVWGVNSYNTSLGGESWQTGSMDSPAYPTLTATASSHWSGVDTTAPTITTGATATSIAGTSADITRVANEPATMKVEYDTDSGAPYANTENDTVLNANKTVGLSGLSPGTTYYVRVTSYDGQANGTTETEFSFTTQPVGKPTLTLALDPTSDPDATPDGIWWASWSDYVAGELTLGLKVTNPGSLNAFNVQITGGTSSTSAVMINTPYSLGNIASGGGTAATTVKYDPAPPGFIAYIAGSAEDVDETTYTYPPES